MHLDTIAIIVSVLPHGEHGAVVRFLTPANGLVAGYVRGGRSRRFRPVLQPGNGVAVQLRARVDSQLAAATVELTAARAALASDGVSIAALDWLTALTARALPEDEPHAAIYRALDALTGGIAAGADALTLGAGAVRYEWLLLAELGFAPDVSRCVATGATADLAYVSPKSSQAVSRGAGLPYAARLLPLPAFLTGDAIPDLADIADGFRLTRFFLERDVLVAGGRDIFAARQRLLDRLRLIGGT